MIASSDKTQLDQLALSILKWSRSNLREFYWRSSDVDSYRIVVTELLLQRTRAETVASFAPSFFEKFDSWEKLDKANRKDVMDSLSRVGLQSRRTTTLISLARRIVENDGHLPRTRDEILELPGVGQYVANAIELLIFGRPRPLLDSSMARLVERYVRPRTLSDIRYDPWLQESTQYLIEQDDPKLVSWAVLDFAALVCKPRKPHCFECPVAHTCNFVDALAV